VAEVDLHIHELMEDPANLENGEILDFQRSYFLKCLDAAMMENFHQLTVIHGVGNGVLKSVVTDILKKQEGISFSDAPMNKYGAGAIEIRLHRIRNR
jgi:DNA-nicking Smr family endonuclease